MGSTAEDEEMQEKKEMEEEPRQKIMMDSQQATTTSSNDDTNNNSNVNSVLDSQWFYYQNPTTGAVSNHPLTTRQLIPLLIPIREGMKPILPATVNCLGAEKEWKPANQIPVLQEAGASWYVNTAKDPNHPHSCRSLLDILPDTKNNNEDDASSWPQLYAPGVTPEWTSLAKLPHLQIVIEALHQQRNVGGGGDTIQQDVTSSADQKVTNASNSEVTEEEQQVQDELEAFLSSTAQGITTTKKKKNNNNLDDDEEEEDYESDGGTRYVKDPNTGNWIHEALAPQRSESKKNDHTPPPPPATTTTTTNPIKKKKKKSNQPKFSKKHAKHWIYVTGLPTTADDGKNGNVTKQDLAKYFGKCGMLDLDPETLQPKIKVYDKGDASICYARSESVELAIQILNDSPWDHQHTIHVERATFQAKPTDDDENDSQDQSSRKRGLGRRPPISEAKRKVARLALLQAQDEGFGERLAGGRKGLRIVVVHHMLDGIPEAEWESTIQDLCEPHGHVEKITCIAKTQVVLVKFVEPSAASNALQAWNGQYNNSNNNTASKNSSHGAKKKMEAIYWDGVTDYTHPATEDNPEEEQKRLEDFGKWLDTQQEGLPPELQLQVAEE